MKERGLLSIGADVFDLFGTGSDDLETVGSSLEGGSNVLNGSKTALLRTVQVGSESGNEGLNGLTERHKLIRR